MVCAEDIIKKLNMSPLPQEGGYYNETYRSPLRVSKDALAQLYPGDRDASTCIYYLITQETFSSLHRIIGDEIFHFYLGDPVEMVQIYADGSHEVIPMGSDVLGGMHPQVVVKGGVWQGLRLVEGGAFALMGTTVAPGFEFEDFEVGDREALTKKYPQHAELIRKYTYD